MNSTKYTHLNVFTDHLQVLTPSSWPDEERIHASPSPAAIRPPEFLFDRPASLMDDAGGFFDRKGSLFDNERHILAANSESNGVSRVEHDANNYKIHVSVPNFKPEELVVKTIDNNKVQVLKLFFFFEKRNNKNNYNDSSFNQC